MDFSFNTLLLISLAVSAVLTGLIWTIQVVHYPGFLGVGTDGFLAYQHNHMRTISYLVIPLMLAELGLACWLPFSGNNITWPIYLSSALVIFIWTVTLLISSPLHGKLATHGYNDQLIRRLVSTNWLRTAAWSLRTVLLFYVVLKLVQR